MPDAWLEAARNSPVYKMAIEWKIAFPLHPEYRTLPMVWYVPPLSPIQAQAEAGELGVNGAIPDVGKLRIPLRYLANLLTAGEEAPVRLALERLLAMRAYMRARHVDGVEAPDVLAAGRARPCDGGGHVPDPGARRLRGPLRHPHHAPRIRRERLRPAQLMRIFLWQWLLRRHHDLFGKPKHAHGVKAKTEA